MTLRAGLRVALLGIPLLLVSAQSTALEVRISAKSDRYSLGEGIEIELKYVHDGDEPMFIARPRSFIPGPSYLRVVAERKGCQFEARSLHLDSFVESLKFFWVPLLPGDALIESLPTISPSDGVPLLELLLPGPGTYSLYVEFVSKGNQYEAFIGPIWRGEARSNELTLKLQEPSPTLREKMRVELKECVENENCMATSASRYFMHVKDPVGEQLLTQALQIEPNDTMAAEALFRQGTPHAAETLERIASTPLLESEVQEFYLSLAEQAEQAPRHPCPRVLAYDW